ncbi:MAG TPA: hypothetical protein VE262_24365 [Blastocatellia bacterium]|nr:hypothetical protein [Blastocatellia bacterium]
MKSIHRKALVLFAVLAALASTTFAQGPLHKRVNYEINVRHALRMGDYMLPPGRYVLYQIHQNDVNLFGLYQEDLTNEPVAMIRTVRVEHPGADAPDDTKLVLEMDESGAAADPILRGWNIPGMDGWEIISVVSKNDSVLTKVR